MNVPKGYSKDPRTIFPESNLVKAQPTTLTIDSAVAVIPVSAFERTTTTVDPRVTNDRTVTDKGWSQALLLCYAFFLFSALLVTLIARPKYDMHGVLAEEYRQEVNQCCDDIKTHGYNMINFGLCDNKDGRDLTSASGLSKFEGDEGIFDVFLMKPYIILGATCLTLLSATAWLFLLQEFALGLVYTIEIGKLIVLLYAVAMLMSIDAMMAQFLALVLFGCGATYFYIAQPNYAKAGEVISHAAGAVKKHAGMMFGLISLNVLFALQTGILLGSLCASREIVDVRPVYNYDDYSAICRYEQPAWVRCINYMQVFIWLWVIMTFDKIRLFVVATIVGSGHFHPDDTPTFREAISRAVKSSLGTLAFAGLITSTLERVQKIYNRNWWALMFFCGPGFIIGLIWLIIGNLLIALAHLYTKFAVVLHAFTNLPMGEAAHLCQHIMHRRFIGGFITGVSADGVLFVGSMAFSTMVARYTWEWIDDAFACSSFENSSYLFGTIVWAEVFPISSLIIIIIINVKGGSGFFWHSMPPGEQHLWLPPLAAAFVGCAARIVFRFVSRIIIDAVDTMFLCFAIDEDNGIVRTDEFAKMVRNVSSYIHAEPVKELDPEIPVSRGTFEGNVGVVTAQDVTADANKSFFDSYNTKEALAQADI